jgi:hypothetical protein
MSSYFCVLLLFASYGTWCVVFHGMLTPISIVGGGALLLGLFWLCDEMRLLNGRKMCLVRGGDKYLMVTKAKDLGFPTQIHLNSLNSLEKLGWESWNQRRKFFLIQIRFVVLKLVRGMFKLVILTRLFMFVLGFSLH